MRKLGKNVKRNYVVHKAEVTFKNYLFGQMVYHKLQFFVILPFEGCV